MQKKTNKEVIGGCITHSAAETEPLLSAASDEAM